MATAWFRWWAHRGNGGSVQELVSHAYVHAPILIVLGRWVFDLVYEHDGGRKVEDAVEGLGQQFGFNAPALRPRVDRNGLVALTSEAGDESHRGHRIELVI